jgi:osmotically-inducible protein OsmY
MVRRAPSIVTSMGSSQPSGPPSRLQQDAQQAVASSSRITSKDNIQVVMDGDVLVLQGSVANDNERRFVENTVRMTPGVRDVRNELTTAPASGRP